MAGALAVGFMPMAVSAASKWVVSNSGQIAPGAISLSNLSTSARAALHGANGATGAAGAIGLTGANGANGATGAAGAIGLTGANGTTGATGPAGAIGLTGAKGDTGAAGPAGATGTRGYTGATGNPGPSGQGVTNYNVTVNTPGASYSSANTVTIAMVGPFTITGYCYTDGSYVTSETYVTTNQDHSAYQDYYGEYNGVADWMSGNIEQAGRGTSGTQGSPDFTGPSDGSTSMISADGSTYVNLFAGGGNYIGSGGGATTPACTFAGYYTAS